MLPSETSSTKNKLSRWKLRWKLFYTFVIVYFTLRTVAELVARKPVGGIGGWHGVASRAMDGIITGLLFALLFPMVWEAIINWRQKNRSKQ